MLKHAHMGFQSDIFLTLLVAGAELTLGHAHDGSTSHIDLEQFLQTDMSRSVILSVSIPPASANTKVGGRRAQESELRRSQTVALCGPSRYST